MEELVGGGAWLIEELGDGGEEQGRERELGRGEGSKGAVDGLSEDARVVVDVADKMLAGWPEFVRNLSRDRDRKGEGQEERKREEEELAKAGRFFAAQKRPALASFPRGTSQPKPDRIALGLEGGGESQ